MLLSKKHCFYALLFLCLSLFVYGHAGHDHDHDHDHEMDYDEEGGMEDMELDEGMFTGEEESSEGEGEAGTDTDDENYTGPYKLDGDVIVLTAKNFDSVVQMYPILLVEFYAPWCGHCKALAPHYAEAATILKKLDTPLYIAKVDAANEKNSALAKKYDIQGFPVMKLFRNSTEPETTVEYKGPRTAEGIVKYMKHKYEPITTIKEKETLTKLLNANEVAVVFYVPETDKESHQMIQDLASADDNAAYGITSDKSFLDESDKKAIGDKGLILFKDFDEGKNVFDSSKTKFTKENIMKFINEHKSPLVITYTQEKASQIFGGSFNTHVLLFSDAEKDYHKSFIESTKKAATENKGKALHVFVPNTEANILKHFKLEDEHLPAVIIVNLGKAMKKYHFQIKDKELVTAINEKKYTDELIKFEKQYFDGKLKQTLNSEEPIDDSKDAVKYIVGKDFEKRVMKADKDVLLEFYAPWCGHCKALAPKYEELAEKLKGVDSIMIAKMDYTVNEIDHPEVEIQGFPTLYFFPKSDKSKAILFKEDKRDVPTLLEFIQKHASPFELDGEQYGTGSDKEEKEEEPAHEEL